MLSHKQLDVMSNRGVLSFLFSFSKMEQNLELIFHSNILQPFTYGKNKGASQLVFKMSYGVSEERSQ